MADKNINELSQIEALDDEALLVVEQGGEAKKMSGAQLRTFAEKAAEDAIQPSVEAAQKAAGDAEQAAAEIDPDAINNRIALKGDNLEFDTEEGLLYLTSGGERISDGIKVATSGGGGGGGSESNNAVLTLRNTSGWIYKTLSEGAACAISFAWSSLEDGMETGPGVLRITVNNTVKHTGQIVQGDVPMDISAYLTPGSNTVKVNVADVYGNSRTITYNLTVVALSLTSTFDAATAYTGDITYTYTPTGSALKTVYFILDGKEIGTETVSASGRQQPFTIPAQSHGSHTFEVYFTAEVDGETVESNHLYYDLICYESGNTTPIITTRYRETTAEQFQSLAIPYVVYDPANLTASIVLSDGTTSTPLTVGRTEQIWAYRPKDAGNLTLSITCGNAIKLIEMTVTESDFEIEAETNNLSLYLTSYGRSNSEANPAEWKYGSVAANLTGFNFASDGWVLDDDNITVLRVSGDARVEIPVQVFAQDFRTTGKTIEIEFASRNVLDYDAILATCWSGDRGLQITAQQAMLRSEQSAVTTNYKEDDHLRLSFVIEKRSGNRLILAYVNGIISGMVQYPADDDFSQSAPVSVSLGSNDCTIDIYNIRVYDNDLTRFQVLDNWIADTQNMDERKDRYDRNNIFNEYGQILPGTLQSHQCYMIIDCPVLPTFKGDKKTCSGTYVDPVHPERSFTFTGAEIDVQGTSSQYYYVKNFKIKFKGGFTRDGATSETYAMNANAVPTNEFTFKADVASSEGANNVVLAEMYNELCPIRTPAQERDPRVRQTIEGHPIVMFHNDGSGAKFIGKYNFNNDKGTPEVFGFASGDESWEILENGNELVSFKNPDFTNWQTSFEARYPEDNTDITKLKAFVEWVASTDTSAVSTEAEKTARLEKFKAEIGNWCDVDNAVFYYLFTLIFLCIDQREKNAFPTWNAEMGKWIWLFYDADSSLGTDNKGNLTFEYWMEDIDYTDAGDPVFNGQNNVFWTNIRLGFPEKIQTEYKRLRTELRADGRPLLSYEVVDDLFATHQSQWSEAIYNEDAWRKAVEPLEQGDALYLPMQQGKKEQHFKHWTYNRFRYMDSRFETGSAMSDRITMRAHAQGSVFLTSYINMYGQVYFNAAMDQHRMVRDQEYEFQWAAVGAEDAVIGVNNAAMLTSLGDLSPLMIELIDISGATHLTALKLGDSAADYVNDNLNSITLGNNTLLRTLDVRNCVSLTQAVDASGCTNIEEIYFDGTGITGLTLPDGGILKVLHLPATVTNLTIRNQPKLTEFSMPSYANVTTLRLENVPACVDGWTILHQIPSNSRVRMMGFDWTQESATDVLALYDYLDTMRGLDESGNNVDKPQMSGTVRVQNVSAAQLSEMQRRYPSIKVVYENITANLYYYNGSVLLYTQELTVGADGSYTGATPTKESTAQYSYVFTGWALTDGGAADANALKNVTEDRKVYAAYEATVRSYTVRFYNGSTLMATGTVEYGSNAAYSGATPTKAATAQYNYSFAGWSRANDNSVDADALSSITGDRDVYACFTGILRSYTVSFYNGTTLLKTETVAYGGTAVYSGTAPTKAATAQYSYAFSGWSKADDGTADSDALTGIAGDRAVYACFTSTVNNYTVRFFNGSTLLQTITVAYGGTPVYGAATPTKTSTAQYSYAFTGWSKADDNTVDSDAFGIITGNRDLYACFAATVNKYTVSFYNGSALLSTATVAYGETAVYSGETPTKDRTDQYIYSFSGWSIADDGTVDSDALTNIAEDRSVYAIYDAISPGFETAYSVKWDYSQSGTSLTRTGLSASFADPVPATSLTATGSSPFDNIMPWAGMKKYNIIDGAIAYSEDDEGFSMTDYDTVVYIPEFWFKAEKDTSAQTWRWAISPTEQAGFTKHPGSGRYIGRYHTSGDSSAVFSKSGVAPLVNTNRTNFRTYSHNKGDKWWMLDIATWSALQMLYLIEFADFHSQNALGKGYGSNSQVSGASDGAVYHTVNGGNTYNQYRWVEQPFGRIYDWVDGFMASSRKCYLGTDNATFADSTSALTAAGVTLPSSDYITGFGYSEKFPWAFLPDEASGGSASTFVPDYVYSNVGNFALSVGGYYSSDGYYGFWYFSANISATYAYGGLSSRLIYVP